MDNEEKILDILAAMQNEMQSMESRIMNHVNILIENEVSPKFKLLAEGQQMILETLTPKSRVDDLEDEVKVLKLAIRQIALELQELKQAQ